MADPICAVLDLATSKHELRYHKSSGGESGGAAVVPSLAAYSTAILLVFGGALQRFR